MYNTVYHLKNSSGSGFMILLNSKSWPEKFFKELYSAEHVSCDPSSFNFPPVSDTDIRLLNKPICDVEIHIAIRHMEAFKASGPNGFSLVFYQKYWHIVGEQIIHFVTCAFEDGHFLNNLNESRITLVHKQEVPETIAYFCPIVLSNMVVKITTKVIANRLKPVMPFLVGEHNVASFQVDKVLVMLLLFRRSYIV